MLKPAMPVTSAPDKAKQVSAGNHPIANRGYDERMIYASGVSRILFSDGGEIKDHSQKVRTAWCQFLNSVGFELSPDPDDGLSMDACRIIAGAQDKDQDSIVKIIELLNSQEVKIRFVKDQIEIGLANKGSGAFGGDGTIDEEGSMARDVLKMFYKMLGFPSDKFDDLLKNPRGWHSEAPKEMKNEKAGSATNTPSTVGTTPANPELALGQMGVTLGFITTGDLNNALEEQKVDEAIGQKKPLCGYLFEAGKLTKAQIAKMISSVEKK